MLNRRTNAGHTHRAKPPWPPRVGDWVEVTKVVAGDAPQIFMRSFGKVVEIREGGYMLNHAGDRLAIGINHGPFPLERLAPRRPR